MLKVNFPKGRGKDLPTPLQKRGPKQKLPPFRGVRKDKDPARGNRAASREGTPKHHKKVLVCGLRGKPLLQISLEKKTTPPRKKQLPSRIGTSRSGGGDEVSSLRKKAKVSCFKQVPQEMY